MPQGISIHVGLNRVDPDHYQGWDGELVACEFDANDMTELAAGKGFEPQTLLTDAATADALLGALDGAAGSLEDGDVLLLTYSGHGGQVPDANGDEDDGMDETWVLYDRQVVDDELYAQWAKFAPGVRIAIFSDSCHSGTVGRAALAAVGEARVLGSANGGENGRPRIKGMPDPVIRSTYEQHKELYDDIQRSLPPFDDAAVGASVLLTSGCQDNQTSLDGQKNGLFTQTLLEVWDHGAFRGGYRTFHRRIAQKMPPWQSPNLFTVGAPNARFTRQHPFTI
ncbi:MAG TPA: caspase family protein [Gaiellaceae bacterium]|nr:caspase family protein [Gaiellaceae bacterium]